MQYAKSYCQRDALAAFTQEKDGRLQNQSPENKIAVDTNVNCYEIINGQKWWQL